MADLNASIDMLSLIGLQNLLFLIVWDLAVVSSKYLDKSSVRFNLLFLPTFLLAAITSEMKLTVLP